MVRKTKNPPPEPPMSLIDIDADESAVVPDDLAPVDDPTAPYIAPTDDEWRALYAAAEAYNAAAPWKTLTDADVFGVENPRTGEIGYCLAMGQLGETFGLLVNRGTAGLGGMYRMWESGDSDPESVLMLQNAVALTMLDRDQLEAHERQTIKRLGLKYRGRGAWPSFMSCYPGYAPWKLSSDEAVWLRHALEQSVIVCRHQAADPLYIAAPGDLSAHLVRVPFDSTGDGEWRDDRRVPAPYEEPPRYVTLSDAARDRIKAFPQTGGTLELGNKMLPIGMISNERQPLMSIATVVDASNGLMLSMQTFEMLEMGSGILTTLIEAIFNRQGRPASVRIPIAGAAASLIGFCELFDIDLVVGRIPQVEKAMREFERFMFR